MSTFSSLIGGDDGAYENFREFIDTEHSPEFSYIAKCRRQMGFQGLNTLTPIMRERFLLHYLHGFTTAEIANLQSVSDQYRRKDKRNIQKTIANQNSLGYNVK